MNVTSAVQMNAIEQVRESLAPRSGGGADGLEVFIPGAPVIQYERILRIQGYSDFSRVRPAIHRAAHDMAQLAPALSAPRVAYRRVAIASLDTAFLRLGNGVQLGCEAFGSTLRNCTEVAVFAMSLGSALDGRVIGLTSAGELLEALLLETTCWLCIEDATRQFKAHLRNKMTAEQRRITSRMGPGYSYRINGETCVWPLEQQSALFETFAGAELPVTLTSSNAMLPKMSRSGLFGIAPITQTVRSAPASFHRLALSAF